MNEKKVWYTIEKVDNMWIVWKNARSKSEDRGSEYCRGIFKSTERKDCVEYCKKNNIKTSRCA